MTVLLEPILEAYLDALRRRHRSDSTLACNRQALGKLDAWLAERGLELTELEPLECEQYFEQQLARYAVSTLHHDLSVVRAACRYAVRHDWLERDPTIDVKLPRLPDIEPATYSNDELRAIHAAIRDPRDERVFYLFAFAGLRECEAAGLQWPHVDFAHEQLRLTGKGGKFRLVPLHPALSELLREHRRGAHPDHPHLVGTAEGGRMSKRSWVATVRGLVDRAGVPTRAPAHTFRKTVATVMHEQGVPTAVIDKILGWAPRTVRDRHYLRIADQTMRDAILTLYRDDPIIPEQLRTRLTPHTHEEPAPPAWLAREHELLDDLERRIAEHAGTSRDLVVAQPH
jgi:integrase/recombinase XerD